MVILLHFLERGLGWWESRERERTIPRPRKQHRRCWDPCQCRPPWINSRGFDRIPCLSGYIKKFPLTILSRPSCIKLSLIDFITESRYLKVLWWDHPWSSYRCIHGSIVPFNGIYISTIMFCWSKFHPRSHVKSSFQELIFPQ